MAYSDVAALQEDIEFLRRVAACVAIETLGDEVEGDPLNWAVDHSWEMASQPGFGDAYASALAQDPPNEHPGRDASVITDGQILGAVQSLAPAE